MDDQIRELHVSGDLAKAHLFLFLLPRSERVRLYVEARVFTVSLFAGPTTPVRLTAQSVLAEVVEGADVRAVEVAWGAVWAIQADDDEAHVVDDRPDGVPPPAARLTLVRGGKA